MKVLIYTHAFAPNIGGVEMNTMLLARGLAKSLQVSVAPGEQRSNVESDGRQGGVQTNEEIIVTVATQTLPDGFDDSILPFRVVRQPRVRELWRLVGEADVIHLAGPVLLPLALGLSRGRPIVIAHHGYQAVCPNGLLLYEPTKMACPGHFMARRYYKCLQCNAVTVGLPKSILLLLLTSLRRWMCKQAAVNVGVTNHVLRRTALPRTRTIYHGLLDPLAVPQPSSSSSTSLPPVASSPCRATALPLCFAYMGRLVSEKGLPLLLESARRLKDEGYVFQLKFIGDGPDRSKLEAQTDALGLREQVQFTGFLQGEVLQKALGDVAAVVMPSIWEETAGMAAVEQMIRGRLVIAADIGGLGEMIGDAGMKFPPGDVAGLTQCMREVLEHPNLLTELGTRARQRALQLFRLERRIDEYMDLYRRLLDRQGERCR